MNNDLISRSALIKELKEEEAECKAQLHENDNDDQFVEGVLSALFTLLKIIESQPGYDISKVQKQLQQLKEESYYKSAEGAAYAAGENGAYNKALEIVKAELLEGRQVHEQNITNPV